MGGGEDPGRKCQAAGGIGVLGVTTALEASWPLSPAPALSHPGSSKRQRLPWHCVSPRLPQGGDLVLPGVDMPRCALPSWKSPVPPLPAGRGPALVSQVLARGDLWCMGTAQRCPHSCLTCGAAAGGFAVLWARRSPPAALPGVPSVWPLPAQARSGRPLRVSCVLEAAAFRAGNRVWGLGARQLLSGVGLRCPRLGSARVGTGGPAVCEGPGSVNGAELPLPPRHCGGHRVGSPPSRRRPGGAPERRHLCPAVAHRSPPGSPGLGFTSCPQAQPILGPSPLDSGGLHCPHMLVSSGAASPVHPPPPSRDWPSSVWFVD